jgi:hypothetical protein
LQKLKLQINLWVDNIVQSCVSQGEARVAPRLDGRLQTPGPTDLFNLVGVAAPAAPAAAH